MNFLSQHGLDIYIILAIGYNLISLLLNDFTGRSLAPTDPLMGIKMMAIVYIWFRLEANLSYIVWVFGGTIFTYLIARGGIYRHATGYASDLYHSRFSWIVAQMINIFGVSIFFGMLVGGI